MELIAACIATTIVYAVLESVWLTTMTSFFYRGAFAEFQEDKLAIQSPLAVALVYVVIIKAFFWLVVLPITNERLTPLQALLRGAAFGSAAYGVYNLTNKATLPGYPWTLVIIDSAWGMFLFAFMAVFFRFAST